MPEKIKSKCLDVEGDYTYCQQQQCISKATCITRVAGFLVHACQLHHQCDRRWKDVDMQPAYEREKVAEL